MGLFLPEMLAASLLLGQPWTAHSSHDPLLKWGHGEWPVNVAAFYGGNTTILSPTKWSTSASTVLEWVLHLHQEMSMAWDLSDRGRWADHLFWGRGEGVKSVSLLNGFCPRLCLNDKMRQFMMRQSTPQPTHPDWGTTGWFQWRKSWGQPCKASHNCVVKWRSSTHPRKNTKLFYWSCWFNT